jgi:4-hydroxy-tetrahydrodipicolinate synthase
MSIKAKPHGVLPAIVTPLDENGEIIEASLRKLIDYTIDNGVHGLFVIGTTGEFYGLTQEQKRELTRITLDQNKGRVPVYAGVGGVTTKECLDTVNILNEFDLKGISVITPYFISPNYEELKQHFLDIANASKHPVLLYNNFDRTKVNIPASLVQELSKEENIIGIKDSSGDMTLLAEYIRLTKDSDFSVFVGRDSMILANMVYGGVGAVAATANIAPRLVVDIYENCLKGDYEKAKELQAKLAPLRMAFSIGSFPVSMKEALKMVGIDSGAALKPIMPLKNEDREKLESIVRSLGVYGAVK